MIFLSFFELEILYKATLCREKESQFQLRVRFHPVHVFQIALYLVLLRSSYNPKLMKYLNGQYATQVTINVAKEI